MQDKINFGIGIVIVFHFFNQDLVFLEKTFDCLQDVFLLVGWTRFFSPLVTLLFLFAVAFIQSVISPLLFLEHFFQFFFIRQIMVVSFVTCYTSQQILMIKGIRLPFLNKDHFYRVQFLPYNYHVFDLVAHGFSQHQLPLDFPGNYSMKLFQK